MRTLVTVAIAMPLSLRRLESDVRRVRSSSIVFLRRVATLVAMTTMKTAQHPSARITTPTTTRAATVVCSPVDPIFANSWPAAPAKTASAVGAAAERPGVGAVVTGRCTGSAVGSAVGTFVVAGASVGLVGALLVGVAVGAALGPCVACVGADDGADDGVRVGATDGTDVLGAAIVYPVWPTS